MPNILNNTEQKSSEMKDLYLSEYTAVVVNGCTDTLYNVTVVLGILR